jgi:hypothetical protein
VLRPAAQVLNAKLLAASATSGSDPAQPVCRQYRWGRPQRPHKRSAIRLRRSSRRRS